MIRVKAVAATAILLLGVSRPTAFADARADAEAQVQFGIEVARKGLWREARFRFERAVELDPSYADAYNNLGVVYEQEGLFEKAREAYEKAMALDPKDDAIRRNYEIFIEIHDRSQKPPQ